MENLLEKIARELLGIETLEKRFSDSLDFQECHVNRLREALNAAYAAGRASKCEGFFDTAKELVGEDEAEKLHGHYVEEIAFIEDVSESDAEDVLESEIGAAMASGNVYEAMVVYGELKENPAYRDAFRRLLPLSM